ncbi:hypothetical protein B0H11DRAFT_2317459 [Mycena galericulata]|nr:hypothetical protein B0H11DRAFT_2317459 [Mycena galericulata]
MLSFLQLLPWTRTTTTIPPCRRSQSPKQPSMVLSGAHENLDEKSPAYYAHSRDDDSDTQWSAPARASHTHTPCHTSRLKRLLPAILLTLLLLSGLLALAYLLGDTDPGELIDGVLHVKRAVTGSGSGGSSFTRRKLYLIVVFVGLFVVLVLAVMLSAWCCRGTPPTRSLSRSDSPFPPFFRPPSVRTFLPPSVEFGISFIHLAPDSLPGMHRLRAVRRRRRAGVGVGVVMRTES